MSYGERPYWNLTNRDVIKSVEEGYRLPAPMGCPAPLHTLMLDCWQKERNERPRFCQIITVLDKLIRNPENLKNMDTLSSPLMERSVPDLSSCSSVDQWLDTIKMGRYKERFAAGGFHTLGHVISINQGDMQRLGVTLMGHQKKIMTSVQKTTGKTGGNNNNH
uniref:Ephrin type-A receptor 4a-like n=1 Tax=Gouania willdenowi TaxID=441366 RepID=A0A8C5G3Z3_GOUWI